jgi:hypothetical protein
MFFKIRKTLEDAVAKHSAEALATTDSPLVFGHVCLGSLTATARAPYDGLRITEIAAMDSAALPIVAATASKVSHGAAFRRHINRFGRSATLLDWLTRRMYRTFAAMVDPPAIPVCRVPVLVSPGSAVLRETGDTISASRELFQTLVDANFVGPYFNELYAQATSDDGPGSVCPALSYIAEQFVGLRLAAQRLIEALGAAATLQSLSTVYQDTPTATRNAEDEWKFLAALQTALMYVWAAHQAGEAPVGFVSVGACYRMQGVSVERCPLAVLSAVLPASCEGTQMARIANQLETILTTKTNLAVTAASNHRAVGQDPDIHHYSTKTWTPNRIRNAVTNELQNAFPTEWFQPWRRSLVLWLSLIAERLRGTVHEGQPLNFSFVVADRSEILDSGLFEVVGLTVPDDSTLVPLNDQGMAHNATVTDALLKTAVREIEKKNYSWFLDGKYALLWDASFPNKHPQHLIRIKDSSWEVFQNHIRLGKESRAARIVRSMVFVATDGSGGLVLNGKQVASFRKGQEWSDGSSDREQKLRDCVTKHIKKWQITEDLCGRIVKTAVDALLAISDDPHAGCMLVIFEQGQKPKFEHMGEVWQTSYGKDFLLMSRDVLTSLMSMDGAACLFFEDENACIEFRRLVTAPDEAKRTLHQDVREKLDGAGSRKWSAANAAKRNEVGVVISVSQDGPIHIYEAKNEKVEVDEL